VSGLSGYQGRLIKRFRKVGNEKDEIKEVVSLCTGCADILSASAHWQEGQKTPPEPQPFPG